MHIHIDVCFKLHNTNSKRLCIPLCLPNCIYLITRILKCKRIVLQKRLKKLLLIHILLLFHKYLNMGLYK